MEWDAHHLILIGFITVISFVFLIVVGMLCAQSSRITKEKAAYDKKLREMGLDPEAIALKK